MISISNSAPAPANACYFTRPPAILLPLPSGVHSMASAAFSAAARFPQGVSPAPSIRTCRRAGSLLAPPRSCPRGGFSFIFPAARRRAAAAPRCAQTPGSGEGNDHQPPLESALLKLFAAVKDGNVQKVSDLASDLLSDGGGGGGGEKSENRPETLLELFSAVKDGSIPFPQWYKAAVLPLLQPLWTFVGNSVRFKVRPTAHEGTEVGVAWRLDWNKSHQLLEGTSSVHTAHHYKGKMFLRNVEMFVEPITGLMEQVRSTLNRVGKKGTALLLTLLLLSAVSLAIMKKLPR